MCLRQVIDDQRQLDRRHNLVPSPPIQPPAPGEIIITYALSLRDHALFGSSHSWLHPSFRIFLSFGHPDYKDPILTTHGFFFLNSPSHHDLPPPPRPPRCVQLAHPRAPILPLPITPVVCLSPPLLATDPPAHSWVSSCLLQAIVLGPQPQDLHGLYRVSPSSSQSEPSMPQIRGPR